MHENEHAADLRAAALSDLRHPPTNDNDAGLLAVLLPDVPGEPYGGTTTPEQRRATADAIDSVVQPTARPVHLRALLRAWAASQDQPRWEIRPYNTPNEHVWVILRDQQAVAEAYTLDDARYILAALQSRGSDNAAGIRGMLAKLQTLDENGRLTAVDLQAQGYAVGAPEPGE